MVDTAKQIRHLLATEFDINGNYTINSQGEVDVTGEVHYRGQLEQLPVKFGTVSGNFWASEKNLSSWKNFPREVKGLLVLDNNNLSDWQGCLKKTLSLVMEGNPITSLEGMPSVSGSLDLTGCDLKNLQGISGYINSWVSVKYNPLESFDGFLGCKAYIAFSYNIDLPLLKTLLAKGGVRIYPSQDDSNDPRINPDMQKLGELSSILNRYAKQGQAGAIACAAELAGAGFKGNARW
jgi:hypothetical protein